MLILNTLPNFLPIEYEGISIISLILFCFLFVILNTYHWWNHREHKATSDKIKTLAVEMKSTNKDISEIKTDVAITREAVEWLKKYFEKDK